MKGLGYYAMCKATKNFFQFHWTEDNRLIIHSLKGKEIEADENDYEILELFHLVAE